MKICDVVLNSVWHDPRVTKQVEQYVKYGASVTCVGMTDKRLNEKKIAQYPCPVVLVDRDAVYGGKQRSIVKKLIREFSRIRSIRDAVVAQAPELIHANDLDALIPSYLASRKLKCKLVYDAHEINCDTRYYDKYRLYAQAMRMIERYIVKRCDLMVCVSNAAADHYVSEYHITRPMVVTNCISQDNVIREEVRKHEGFEILNHGMYRDARGFELMVESCDYLKDYPDIVLAARGLGPLEESLRKGAAQKETKNFVFYPPADPRDMIREAACSHVGVAITLPICLNYIMSISNRLFEYAAAGLPVIMSDIPEHRYLNDRYEIGIVIKENTPEAFAEAAVRLYQDREFYESCRRNAAVMSNEINWENEFRKLYDAECACLGCER